MISGSIFSKVRLMRKEAENKRQGTHSSCSWTSCPWLLSVGNSRVSKAKIDKELALEAKSSPRVVRAEVWGKFHNRKLEIM